MGHPPTKFSALRQEQTASPRAEAVSGTMSQTQVGDPLPQRPVLTHRPQSIRRGDWGAERELPRGKALGRPPTPALPSKCSIDWSHSNLASNPDLAADWLHGLGHMA